MTAVNYLWNPLNDNIVREFDDAGAGITEYTTEPDVFGSVVSYRLDAQDNYLHYDGVGSTLAQTNPSGAVTDTRTYSAFGEQIESGGSSGISVRYVGQWGYYYDQHDDSYMVRFRPLAPTLGRWLGPDPMGISEDLDRYRYVSNSPISAVDPSGKALIPIGSMVIVGGRVLIIVGGVVIAVIALALLWKAGCWAKYLNCLWAARRASKYCGRSFPPNNLLCAADQDRCVEAHLRSFQFLCALELLYCVRTWYAGWFGVSRWYTSRQFKKTCIACGSIKGFFPPIGGPEPPLAPPMPGPFRPGRPPRPPRF